MIRLLLVLACVAVLALALLGMRWGWRNRARRQSGVPPLPPVPAELGAPMLPPTDGVYVGTAFATSWQDRVALLAPGRQLLAGRDERVIIERHSWREQ